MIILTRLSNPNQVFKIKIVHLQLPPDSIYFIGFCAKTRNVITSQKIFVNICHTSIIPAPVDVSEQELTRILESDEPSTFRIPMSLGEGHEEVDKCILSNMAYNPLSHTKINYSIFAQQLDSLAWLMMLPSIPPSIQKWRAANFSKHS